MGTDERRQGAGSLRPRSPVGDSARLQWLVDRAEISDLLTDFARALDDRDADAYAALYTDDGVLEFDGILEFPGLRIEGRDRIRASLEPMLVGYSVVWHLSANHSIEFDGDTARARSYLLAVHLHGEDTFNHYDAAGWYDHFLRRTEEGWRFQSVRLHFVWTGGTPPSEWPQ